LKVFPISAGNNLQERWEAWSPLCYAGGSERVVGEMVTMIGRPVVRSNEHLEMIPGGLQEFEHGFPAKHAPFSDSVVTALHFDLVGFITA
jgi:hypothetical protein